MKIRHSILSLILLFAFSQTQAQTAIAPSAGDGSAGNPYEISSLGNLYWIAEGRLSYHYIQTCDIDASPTATYGWTPIGKDYYNKFTGSYNGNGFAIRDLYFNNTTGRYSGFFGNVENAIIRNVTLTNADIRGSYEVGALIGYCERGCTVSNCHASGSVKGLSNIGGLIGKISSSNESIVCNSSFLGNVGGEENVGGITGSSEYAMISHCSSSGTVYFRQFGTYIRYNRYFGGLIGYCHSTFISNSHSSASVSGEKYAAGLIGVCNDSEIRNSYARGSVSGNVQPGGLIGYDGYSNCTLWGCFWDTETSGLDSSAGGLGLSTAEMKTPSTYADAGWNFVHSWDMDGIGNEGYPYLKHLNDPPQAKTPAGSGSAQDPFRIGDLEELCWIAENPDHWDKHYIQTADIDAIRTAAIPRGFLPIGERYDEFTGIYDGQGHTIDKLFIEQTSDHIGLFGAASGATLKNLTLRNFDFYGDGHIGGLAGYITLSTVSHCFCSGNILGTYNYSGGLAGGVTASVLQYCGTEGTLTGTSYCGGLTGQIYSNSSILNCYSRMSVNGTARVGGLIGDMGYTTVVDDCFSTGSVSGNSDVGGLVGRPFVVAPAQNFWDIESSGQSTSGGGTGKSTAEMKTMATYTDAGWDFTNIWGIRTELNDGYPHLFWQYPVPRISDVRVMDIAAFGAGVEIDISYAGNPAVYQYGVCWDTSAHPDLLNSHTAEGALDSAGTYPSVMSGLLKSTRYHVRAYAINALDTSYSQGIDFMTLPCDPVVPASGSGTAEDPYTVSSLENLYWIASDPGRWSLHYIQTADIDASETANWDDGDGGDPEGWSPIGNWTTKFSGSYRGEGHLIENLYLNRPNSSYLGLFGALQSAIIRDLGVKNVRFTGEYEIGGLAGYASSSSISSSYSTGDILGATNLGGLISDAVSSTTISDCYSKVSVSQQPNQGGGFVGGLLAYTLNAALSNCYSMGRITAHYTTNAGGLLGYGGSTSVENSFWDTQTTGYAVSAGGQGKTSAEMKITGTYINWDFSDIWGMSASFNEGYPFLLWEAPLRPPVVSTDSIETVTESGASVHFTVSDPGFPEALDCGLCWNLSGDFGLQDFFTSLGAIDTATSFRAAIDSLSANTPYFVRAYALNNVGIVYGEVLSFRTLGRPSLAGITLLSFDSTTVSVRATLTAPGNPSPFQHGFCWSSSGIPTIEDETIELGPIDSSGTFASDIGGLDQNTRYHIRAYSSNVLETVYSDTISFTTLETAVAGIPREYVLLQNYPNPFNPLTTLSYGLPEYANVEIAIYDLLGRKVRDWQFENQAPGWHKISWDGSDRNAHRLSSGIYIFCMKSGNVLIRRKMLFMK
ncbi:MAG: FlgD immunoglobulin-like domain containing protein [Candidatus Marinimicrobia bacterium]|nr:FlgD immunoglobulin-like domain containing protein [Candidatus Neomarinimicrobiota bacterium]